MKASILAVAATAVAAPAPTNGTFSIDMVTVNTTRSGPELLQRFYSKYGIEVPAHVRKAANITTSVSAMPVREAGEYLVPVTIGQQKFLLDPDTGSSDLWVYSNVTGRKGTVYNGSGTLLDGYSFQIGYGDKSGASGIVYSDKVTIGRATATSQAVEVATSASASFSTDPGDGLLGLAFSRGNTVTPIQQITFFDSIKDSLREKIFAVDLKYNRASSIQFGYADKTKYKGNLTYVPVDPAQEWWYFNSSIGPAIADTGTTFMVLDNSTVQEYYRRIGGTYDSTMAAYTYPCQAQLPFELEIGGTNFVIPTTYINQGDVGNGNCYGGIQVNDVAPFAILGDVFFNAVYTVFDADQLRLGFAAKT